MFVPVWLVFFASGLAMAVFTIVWAVRSRQFDDQQRARFIPLYGLSSAELSRKPERRYLAERLGMWAMVIVGASAICAGLLLTLKHL